MPELMPITQRIVTDDTIRVELLAEILRRVDRTPTTPSANVGASWRSADDLFTWPVPAAQALYEQVHQAFEAEGCRNLRPRAWAVVNRHGSYHARHQHASGDRTTWSGIYYLATGSMPSANTVFELPDGNVNALPIPGLLLLFPAAVFHWTEPQHGPEPRVTIAFDSR